MSKKWTGLVALTAAALFLSGAAILAMEMMGMSFFSSSTVSNYQMTDSVVKNPLIGFAPNAQNEAAAQNNTLVYVDITFRELEPQKGQFDFAAVEQKNKLDQWRSEGKHVVLRFVSDYPGTEEHLDIPDWLYEETGGDGDFYDNAYGKGYSPDYSNPLFIEYHRQAIAALGERYGQDTFVSFVELGSLGHWGEWHVAFASGISPLPDEAVREQYVLPYLEAFPYARLLMRRPFAIAEEYGMGLYNDMAGHLSSTRQWLDWIENGGAYDQTAEEDALVPMADAWEQAPVGGEFTSSVPLQQLITTHLDQTVELLEASHTSFLGPNIPQEGSSESATYQEGVEAVLKSLGYRIGVTQMRWSESRFTDSAKVKLTWENNGTAPLYFDWPVYLYFTDETGTVLSKVEVELDLTGLLPGKSIKTVTEIPNGGRPAQAAFLYVGIEDPLTGQPAITLISDQQEKDHLFLLQEF